MTQVEIGFTSYLAATEDRGSSGKYKINQLKAVIQKNQPKAVTHKKSRNEVQPEGGE